MSAYPNFGKVKTIVLPFSSDDIGQNLERYKNKYGIDLKEFISLSDSGEIEIVMPQTAIYLYDLDNHNSTCLRPSHIQQTTVYDEGQYNAETVIGWFNAEESVFEGINVVIDKDSEYSIDNIVLDWLEA